ncbi:uncharacterized protein N7518_008275 [Penicillium psychrosexuale]|uniref:uncharacterized protein n=1 Tax=Penicillium psychrosexuale TaxID=1002107 RepID=UPI0025452FAC|nr:uncharacterized protein N7518_008275 [Penicillium psychrosexuale]KAJ5791264.1 hypothetical protein N7518_008275 [Penicillium psychrosexuale]
MAKSDCESDVDGSENCPGDDRSYFLAEEFLSSSPYSRPVTPQLYYELHSAFCPVSEDNNFDLTRTCDLVDLALMRRDDRARHPKKALFRYLSDGTDSFVSCEEYLDEETEDFSSGNEEGDLLRAPPSRPKGLINSLEDRSLLFYDSVQEYYPTGQ